jgi:hypothetical protein
MNVYQSILQGRDSSLAQNVALFNVPDSTHTNQIALPLSADGDAVFFRLTHP